MRISDWSSDVCSSDLAPFQVLAVIVRNQRTMRIGKGVEPNVRPCQLDLGRDGQFASRSPALAKLHAERLALAVIVLCQTAQDRRFQIAAEPAEPRLGVGIKDVWAVPGERRAKANGIGVDPSVDEE